ncbi:MAG: hypothetical protein J6K04_00795 [Lachnospiraceae bacterium]|nr:hypothetical protein [Lachnospiraceae bacterium]
MDAYWKAPPVQGIELHNGVGRKNLVFPHRDITKMEKRITLYFNNDGDVIIVGTVENYTFWLSVTKTEDLELNEEIFNHVANDEPQYVTQFPRALEAKEMVLADLVNYYMVHLNRSKIKGMEWETPFGNYYGTEQIKRNGWFFARNVKSFVEEINKQCELRECGGMYEKILEEYAKVLQAATEYDYTVQNLEKVLKAEAYLCLSRRESVRKLYLECSIKCGELYGQYMTKAR